MLESQAEQAYEKLEELIVTLQLAPGASISEGELCERTGLRPDATPRGATAPGRAPMHL
ncbi:MAG: hypothetical protein VW713_00875 [Alphaproteobacteria bacterium]